jgi:hypothetical protein
VLAQWNAQNVTPSPPLWDAAIAGGVLLLLAIPGGYVVARRQHPREMVALLWLLVGALALYAPFALQRRLSIGLWLPLAVLAGVGLREVVLPRLRPRLRPVFVAIAGPALVLSNVLVYAATLGAIASRDTAVFATPAEAAALDWLASNGGRALVAAPPRLGLLIPARTDARVIYGHPFETVPAQAREADLVALFANSVSGPLWVQPRGVDYVLATVGRPPGWTVPSDWRWPVVFEQDGVVIYAP